MATASNDATARIWEIFPSGQVLIDEAKAITLVCLTEKRREQFYLAPEPPDWCITGSGNGLDTETDPANWHPKWPSRKAWLIAKRAGKNPELPKE